MKKRLPTRLIGKEEISGSLKYNKKGEVMRIKQLLEMYQAKVIALETKLGDKTAYLVEEPNELPLGVKRLIMDDFYPVALTAFNQNRSEKFFADVWKHLFNVSRLYLVFNDDVNYGYGVDYLPRGIAFRAVSDHIIGGRKVGYIEGTAVDPNYQGYGFYQCFTKHMKKNYNFVTSRTQNPVVITALSKVFKNVWPIIKEPTPLAKQIGEAMAETLKMKGYDKDEMIGRGFYGKALSGLPPRIDNEISRKMFEKINREAGDCVLAVCR